MILEIVESKNKQGRPTARTSCSSCGKQFETTQESVLDEWWLEAFDSMLEAHVCPCSIEIASDEQPMYNDYSQKNATDD